MHQRLTTMYVQNIELFFCLYANSWENTSQCNSSHSRLLGFFAALPGVWRALQCIRRYIDTRNVFPHLVNCGKYGCTILFYVSLSLYRINKNTHLFAFFIFCGIVNGIYCTIWDLVMDWSLLNPYAKHRFLRDTLAYKQTYLYYIAMFLDPILRFNWIFYAIFADEVQHSAVLSFAVALSEVGRRGMWMIFRVENEHCTNVTRFRAARDVPLPYHMGEASPASIEAGTVGGAPTSPEAQRQQDINVTQSPGSAALARIATGSSRSGYRVSPSLRRRKAEPSPLARGLSRVGTMMHAAHAQDFERRKKDENVGDYALGHESSDEENAETAKAFAEATISPSESDDDVAAALRVPRTRSRSAKRDKRSQNNGNGKDRASDD